MCIFTRDRCELLDEVFVVAPQLLFGVLAAMHEALLAGDFPTEHEPKCAKKAGKMREDEPNDDENEAKEREKREEKSEQKQSGQSEPNRTLFENSSPSHWPTAVSGSNLRATENADTQRRSPPKAAKSDINEEQLGPKLSQERTQAAAAFGAAGGPDPRGHVSVGVIVDAGLAEVGNEVAEVLDLLVAPGEPEGDLRLVAGKTAGGLHDRSVSMFTGEGRRAGEGARKKGGV